MSKRGGELDFVDWVSNFNRIDRRNPNNPATGKPYGQEYLPIITCGRISEYQVRYSSPGGQYMTDQFACFFGELLESQQNLLSKIQERSAELEELIQLIRETERRLVQAGCSDVVEAVLASLEKKNYFDEDEYGIDCDRNIL
jgi:hypothetical protein